MDIDKKLWHICQLCQKKIKDLAKIYGGCGIYYTTVFQRHLTKDHKITIEEYFTKVVDIPDCVCGYNCGLKATVRGIGHSKFYFGYTCGRYKGVMEWSEKAKTTRKGKGNPMYKATPWNKGLNIHTSEAMEKGAKKRRGRTLTPEHRKKLSIAGKKRKVHGHTGHKHSEKTKEFLRQNTLRLIKEGVFKQTKSKPHVAMSIILDKLKISYEEEKQIEYWSFDFYLKDYDILIEVDGDYFHSHPRRWPNGPKSKTQKINWYRDLKKNKFCQENNLNLKRFWEYDILNHEDMVKQEILCMLKK